jgi:metal-sulfur cluster biosynthetic enzyme
MSTTAITAHLVGQEPTAPSLPTREQVMACLHKIVDPCSAASASPMSIVEMGLIRELRIDDSGDVSVFLRLSAPSCYMVSFMATQAQEYIGELPGVREVHVEADTGLDWDPSMIAPEAALRRETSLKIYMNRPRATDSVRDA